VTIGTLLLELVRQLFGFQDRRAAGCLRKQPAGGCRKQAAVYFFSPHRVLCELRSQKSFRINRPLRSPISFYGYLPPLSRRSYQPENRFSSVSRPLLNVSGAASPLRPNELHGRGFHQTNNDRPGQARTTSGLCGCWPKGRGVRSGK